MLDSLFYASKIVMLYVLQLIVHLKMEIQSLKEELALVTGGQRSDKLTQEEIQQYVPAIPHNPSLILYKHTVEGK